MLGACATTRIVPLPAAGVTVDPDGRSATGDAPGIHLAVQPSAWVGEPASLPVYVTPVLLLVDNASAQPLAFDYGDLRLFDEARFQYTALPPTEVERLLRARYGAAPGLLAAAGVPPPLVAPRRYWPGYWPGAWPYGGPWWWGPPYGPWAPYYYPYPPRLDGILAEALPVGVVQPGARVQGFAYFPRLRPQASRLDLEFHYRLGERPGVLRFPLAVQRAAVRGVPAPV